MGIRGWFYENDDELADKEQDAVGTPEKGGLNPFPIIGQQSVVPDLMISRPSTRPREWFYDEPDTEGPLDFQTLYQTCEGTILYRKDCGLDACGTVACCYSTGPDSFIFFLPGELEYQRAQEPAIPFLPVSQHHLDRLHCRGNAGCVYDRRPIDCRSYPYFPRVSNLLHVGYFDCRGAHMCPLKENVELRDHLKHIHTWWPSLLQRSDVLEWAEAMGSYLKQYPHVDLP